MPRAPRSPLPPPAPHGLPAPTHPCGASCSHPTFPAGFNRGVDCKREGGEWAAKPSLGSFSSFAERVSHTLDENSPCPAPRGARLAGARPRAGSPPARPAAWSPTDPAPLPRRGPAGKKKQRGWETGRKGSVSQGQRAPKMPCSGSGRAGWQLSQPAEGCEHGSLTGPARSCGFHKPPGLSRVTQPSHEGSSRHCWLGGTPASCRSPDLSSLPAPLFPSHRAWRRPQPAAPRPQGAAPRPSPHFSH